MLAWTTTGAHALEHGIKVAVHGLSGAGKTRLIATMPGPVAIASAESGTLSIAGNNLPMAPIRTLDELKEFYTWAVSDRQFKSIALDSITEIAERILGIEKGANKDPRKAYGNMQYAIEEQLRLFRDMPGKHVYFSCKTELREMPDGTHMFAPSMPGKKTAQGLPYFFDEFLYLGVGEYDAQVKPGELPRKEKYRYFQTARTLTVEAKDRSGVLAEIEQPDLSHIFAKIANGLTPKTA